MTPDALRRRLLAAGAGVSLLGGAIAWKAWRHARHSAAAEANGPPAAPPAATVINDAQPLPPFTLQGLGGPVTRSALTGHWSIVFFGYTQCPDVCPTTLTAMAQVWAQLPAARRPQVLFISVDPARDTLALLAQYVPAFNPAFMAATGTDDALKPLAQHLGVHYERQPPSAQGTYTVDHTAALYLIDPQARLKAVFSHPPDPAAVVQAYLRFAQ